MADEEKQVGKPSPAELAAALEAVRAPFPLLVSALPVPEIAERLERAARRGRLAGFARGTDRGTAFQVDAFGAYFDGVLVAQARPGDGGTVLRFDVRLKPLMPVVWGAVMVATVWPGVVLMDSFLGMFSGSSTWWPTWWWYLPLTVPFVPWSMWTAVSKSRLAARASAHVAIEKIAAELGAETRLEQPSASERTIPA